MEIDKLKIILINDKVYSIYRDAEEKIIEVNLTVSDYNTDKYMAAEYERTQKNHEQKIQISQ